MSDIAIQIEHLSKMYRLGVINNGTLFRDLQTWIALKRGKDDPHSKIGENKYSGNDDHFWALKDINFEVKQGDRVGIIGKNGAGKSTLLKILSRITTPTEGKIKIKGKISSLLEVGTGFHGELTGRENIYLNGAILGMKKRRIDEKLDSIIDFCGIEHHIDTPVKRYSSGMYVRLAFAVAAHLDNDILIADEVLAVGDAEFQKKALGKMEELSTGEGRTVLFVSHNMGAVKNLCNKGILLQKGNLHFDGSIKNTINIYLSEMIIYQDSLGNRTDRDGNGATIFTDIKLCGKSSGCNLSSTEQLVFSLTLESKIALTKSKILISINTFDNQCLAFLDSEIEKNISDLPKKCVVYVRLSREFALSQNRYYINVACLGNGILTDTVKHAFIFSIIDNEFYGNTYKHLEKGACMIKQEWFLDEIHYG